MRSCLVLLSFCLFNSIVLALDIHVAPNGADSNQGTDSAPVLTLGKARLMGRESRKTNSNEAVTILMHPGTYQIRKTISFNKQDNGTEAAPLTIKNLVDPKNPTARPLLVGGVVVPNWKKSDFNGRSDVWEADLKPLGITKKFKQIYLNGTRQIWARYPNYNPDLPYSGGWAYVDGKRPPMYTDIEGERTDIAVMREKDTRSWSCPADGELCIFPRYNWWNKILPIKEFNAETRTITLIKKMPYAARPEDRYAVFGMKEELDSPGEWYQDVKGQKLYFIPPQDLTGQSVTVPTVNSIMRFDGVENVLIRGLELTCAENQSVSLSKCKNVIIEKSLIHDLGYMGGAGVTIRKGYNCIVRGCDIWNIGGHGVEIYAGDKVKMDKCNHVVDNCYIHHVGQFNRHGIGIMVGGTGVVMSHNLIHDMPRCGVFYGGILHTLEYNRIRHCNLEMEDTGCTYGGGWTGGWTTIRYNHCTDSIGFNNHGKFFVFACGIYLDESGCGYDVYGNIVERCQMGAMHLHNARENHIYNNIFAHNASQKGTTHQLSLQGWNNSPTGVFLRDRQPKMLKKHNELLKNPEWAKMRGMHVSPEDPFLPDGNMMRGNKVERNIFYYPNQPKSRYIKATNVNMEYNTIDYNTIWNGGKTPIKTGKSGYKQSLADLTDKIPNALFPILAYAPGELQEELRKNSNHTEARGWFWYHKTFPDAKSEVVTNSLGKPAFKLFASYNPEKKYIKNACIKSMPFAFEPGKDYCLSFKLCNKNCKGSLITRVVSESNGLWRRFGQKGFHPKENNETLCQTAFHFPAEGEKDFDKRLGKMSIQFQFDSKTGTAEISELKLEQVEKANEWEAWQMQGADTHSIIADPLFVDPDNGDFHLKPESPAIKLGFKPIPLDKIGLYKSDARATWPIKEAEGVRENPQWLQSVPLD
ncbi:MAG: right-handed parallel beta-helix repeat-containing protein [Kiritimatiellae bacterium]|jgi:hypothetical protein|nr:right-handed parallel beta-helix repeat-containing protein [Kiritimatiellia bacterium]